jgi:hypothetical protein
MSVAGEGPQYAGQMREAEVF